MLVSVSLVAGMLAAPFGTTPTVVALPVGEGFTVTPGDLAFILFQIKIAEAHVANTTSATGPCGALLGQAPTQLASPFLSGGLRTVDGSCNNLANGATSWGAANTAFPRLTSPVFQTTEPAPPGFPPSSGSSYTVRGAGTFVYDTEPRVVSNLIVDQTFTNPAAVQAAGPATAASTPNYETLPIPNVTTDVGLSPPFNGMFTLFGQFFDHGVDQTTKGGGTVFVPLRDDDPLVAGPDHDFSTVADNLPPNRRFMPLSRGTTTNALNTDTSWVDQSQTYASHPSHQVFLREYVDNVDGRPVSTGKLLGGILPAGAPAGTDPGMATWESTKRQAADLLGLKLVDTNVVSVPEILVDPYGKFVPGPARGLPQYVTTTGLVEGDRAGGGVPVPNNAIFFETPFLTDIADDSNPVFDPSTKPPGFVPNAAKLNAHFIAGDGRVNENIGLTSVHQVFHSEHDRLVDQIKDVLATDLSPAGVAALPEWQSPLGAGGWNGERLFQAARFITEMEYQHLVFEQFARKIQPAINVFSPRLNVNASVRAEFAHAVYRFGHSMLTETISRTNVDLSNNDIPLLQGFLNPAAYFDNGSGGRYTAAEAAGAVIMGMSDQTGNEIDEFVTDTLRNKLLGLPLDLATINITRARSEGVAPLNVLRRQLHNQTGAAELAPYISWIDFGQNMKHDASLINFVAAYGLHPTILTDVGPDGQLVDDPATPADETADNGPATPASRRLAAQRIVDPVVGDPLVPTDATDFMFSAGAWANIGAASQTGVDDIDLWVGGLAETRVPFGGMLGSTFNFVFENQMADLQDADRFYYLERTAGTNLLSSLEGNSFAELFMRNTTAHSLKADAFSTADCKFQLANLNGTPAGFTASGPVVANDATTECNENALLRRLPDGTIQYQFANSVDPPGINGQSVYNGTNNTDRASGGNDSDTFWGGLGNDVIEGGAGADVALGGEGRDFITDSNGDDIPSGGPGNDVISAGPGLDIVFGGDGSDFADGGANTNETFAGSGNDFVMAGLGGDAVQGDGGDDWLEGGDQGDGLSGDSGSPFFLDELQRPGHDVFLGQTGDDRLDGEGGDDISVGGPGLDRINGAAGFDWQTAGVANQGDSVGVDFDLTNLLLAVGNPIDTSDRFLLVEALSGSAFNDTIRGDSVVPADLLTGAVIGSDKLTAAGIARISGLSAILPAGATTWGAGNILIGGAGSDVLEGRGADDVIDGDRQLQVRMSVRNSPAGAQIGSADALTQPYVVGNPITLQQAILAGTVDPGNIALVREIVNAPNAGDLDTAVFSGAFTDYSVTDVGGVITVTDNVPLPFDDGTDTIRNVESLQFTDQTINLINTSAPSVDSRTPAAGAVDVLLDANVTATFSEAVTGVTGARFTLRQGTAADGVQVPATVTFNAATLTATLNPTGTLTNGFVYTARLLPGITDLAGAALAPVTWSFTAVGAAPAVTATTPINGAVAVPIAANATATFSEMVNGVGDTTFTLRQGTAANGILVPAAVTFDPTTLTATLNPTVDLLPGTLYTARLLTGITDVTALALPATSWSFTTAGALALTVAATTPAANTVGVIVGSNVTATFSRAVAGVSGATFTLRQGTTATGTLVPAAVSLNAANTVTTLNPNANLLPGTVYTARLLTGITSVVGGVALTPFAWSFTTAGTPPPSVLATSPVAGAIGVAVGANTTATFSVPVTGVAASTFTLRVGTTATGALVPRAVSFNALTNVATLNPSANLLPGTVYTARLLAGITSVTGGVALVPVTWSFTTAGGVNPPPTVVATTPAAGATGASRTANITATFSEAVVGVTFARFEMRVGTLATGALVPRAVSYDPVALVATLNPGSTLLANTLYTVRLLTGITDSAGAPLAPVTWSFTTGP